jgi:asparagine synthase (glutamine-hydrolysing)
VKPLYVHDDGRTVRFASEPKAIFEDARVSRIPDWSGVRAVLELGYAAAPHTCFKGLTQIEPASVQRYRTDGRDEWKTWNLSIPEPARASLDEALERLDDVLDRAIARQMVSDVPIGAFLSAGLDSTRVVDGMRRATRERLPVFTVGFSVQEFDESPAAAVTARLLDLDHHVEHVDIDLAATAQCVSGICDDPFADSSTLAVYHLCRVASHGLKVILAGDGADELLAGYATYRTAPYAAVVRSLPNWLRKNVLLPLARAVPVRDRPYSAHQVSRRLLLAGAELPGRAHASWRRSFFDDDERTLLTDDAFAAVRHAEDPIDSYAGLFARWPAGTPTLRRMMAADLLYHLPSDMLVKVDRMSMASGLEVRVPMLDHEFVDFTMTLPPEFLIGGTEKGKRLLKRSLQRRLKGFDVSRPKQGLLVPIAAGFRTNLGTLLLDTLSNKGPFRVKAVQELLARHAARRVDASFELYSILMVTLWWNRFFA